MVDERTELRIRLGAELKRIRTLAGLAQSAIGVRQATVSEIERGLRLPTREQARAWLTHADDDVADSVVALLDRAHLEIRSWDELLDGRDHIQDDTADEVAESVWMRSYQSDVVPGLLQTAEYARAVFTALGLSPAGVSARIQRQQILYEPGRSFVFLMLDRVLDCAPVSPSARAAQLAQIATVASLDTVEIGIVPSASLPVAVPFILRSPRIGPPYAAVELPDAAYRATQPERVTAYERAWERLMASAVLGDDAVAVIRAKLG